MNHIGDILSQKTQDTPTPPSSYTPLSFHDDMSFPEQIQQPIESKELKDIPVSTLDIQKMKSIIYSMKDQLNALVRILDGELVAALKTEEHPKTEILESGEKIIEGVFNGVMMIGEDGKEYAVPPNYASKSKMVEGDLMKLTITPKGSFIYKQIGPTPRKRIIGELAKDVTGDKEQWLVVSDGKPYKVLSAAVSFHKGMSGDEVILLIPQNGVSEWGSIDNIMKK